MSRESKKERICTEEKRGNRGHPGRSKKRSFSTNQHVLENDSEWTSTSSKKLKESGTLDYQMDSSFMYRILQLGAFFEFLSSTVICKSCNSGVSFSEESVRGLGFKIVMQCNCQNPRHIFSCPLVNKAYEINRRLVFVLRLLGVGNQGMNLFLGYMDLGTYFSQKSYECAVNNIYTACKAAFEYCCEAAAKLEMRLNEAAGNIANHITVSGDGTWKTRGFSSLQGVATLIGKYTGKVIDALVKSRYCKKCEAWQGKHDTAEYEEFLESHQDECNRNHEGSAGKMEVDAMLEMFQRSVERYGCFYKYYVGDGDTKTFKKIDEARPYNDACIPEKKECVGHVGKRMGNRLREAKRKLAVIRKTEAEKEKKKPVKKAPVKKMLPRKKAKNALS